MIRGLLPLLLLGAGLLPAAAQTAPPPRGADKVPETLRPWLGAWDLELSDAPRGCTVTLGAEPAGEARELRFPATCRRALPILDKAVAWGLSPGGRPRLLDAGGKELVGFPSGSREAGLDGRGVDGKTYRLLSKAHPRIASARQQDPVAAARRPTAIDPATALAPASLPGRYVLMRQVNREACRLVLSAAPTSTDGRAPAAFDGACEDVGLTIFDPAGWRYEGGRLTLFARRGHLVELVFENGQWRKDPAVGAPLLMRKLAP
ncbi:protease inhibitor Inh/omp19 family protein [Bosea sp. BH3]|uniref:protease inhibitor Inh/omp19 family protein n=1 Tax=Bosea sp. BH3 TaxID=2871701 RepID=UPI0021CB1917|nr:protease inhibitor Inh/omp19 family protein [Bosea sp. BH3]MCU4178379.1 protease inhibitor Inh/omp19 family protein [Bosea sp. BH3]